MNHIEISGGGQTHIPTEADILALAKNDILEIAAGDTVTGTYIDAVTAGGLQRNKALSQTLTATYYNGQILPISYDFVRAGNGGVNEIRKELLRIDPNERITIEVADFDMDSTGTEDTVEVQVQVNDGETKTLTATETGPDHRHLQDGDRYQAGHAGGEAGRHDLHSLPRRAEHLPRPRRDARGARLRAHADRGRRSASSRRAPSRTRTDPPRRPTSIRATSSSRACPTARRSPSR